MTILPTPILASSRSLKKSYLNFLKVSTLYYFLIQNKIIRFISCDFTMHDLLSVLIMHGFGPYGPEFVFGRPHFELPPVKYRTDWNTLLHFIYRTNSQEMLISFVTVTLIFFHIVRSKVITSYTFFQFRIYRKFFHW